MDIKDFQLRYGITNQKAAELCGCSLPTIQKWRSGTIHISGSAERLLRLLDHLASGSPERLNQYLCAAEGNGVWLANAPISRGFIVADTSEERVSSEMNTFRESFELRVKRDELAASEARYRAMVETQTDAICRWTPDMKLTFVNQAHCRFFGLSSRELIGRRWIDFASDVDVPTTRAHIQRMVSTKTHRRYEQRLTIRNGEEVVLEWTDTPLVRSDGAVTEIQSVGRDVTARVRAEEHLHAKLAVERTITKLSSSLLSGNKPEVVRTISECLEQLGNFGQADRSYLYRISDDRQTFSNVSEWCNKGIQSVSDDFQQLSCSKFKWGMGLLGQADPLMLYDVTTIPSEAEAEMQVMLAAEAKSILILPLNVAGVSYGFIGLVTVKLRKEWTRDDVAFLRMVAEILALNYSYEEKAVEIERQRRKIENDAIFTRTLLDAIPFPIFSKNSQFEYGLCNRAFSAGVGHDLTSVRGKTVYDIAPESMADKQEQMDRVLMAQGGQQSYETQFMYADGSVHDILFTKSVYGGGNEFSGLVGIMQDVTDQNYNNKQLQKAKDVAESAAMTKTRLLSNVSHELRAPLHIVLAMAEFLEGKVGVIDDDERLEVLGLITDSARQLWVMIDELLALSHIESGRLRVNRSSFDLAGMCKELGAYYGKLAKDRGLEFSWEISTDFPEVVISSDYRVRQVLIQLVSNALKFTEHGSVLVRSEYEPATASGKRDLVCFDIHDTGVGIDSESCDEIYRVFEELDVSNYKRHSGLGIGLAVARRLARGLGGDISFISELGRGSHFNFTLPVEVQAAALPVMNREGSAELGATVLVVDDNALNRIVLCRMLEKMGMCPLSADSGRQALELFANESCDLVLLDIQMPNMDGFELLAAIREVEKVNGKPEIPVVAVTAYALPSERNRFLRAGMNDFLPKPFTFDELRRVTFSALAGVEFSSSVCVQ